MKAAARTMGSLLVAQAVRSPHTDLASVKLNGCGPPGYCLQSKMTVTATAPQAQQAKCKHVNGLVEASPVPVTPAPLKTRGESSNETSDMSLVCGSESNRDWLMCPELAMGYTGTVIGRRANCLSSKQKDLEQRVTALQRKVRQRQLNVVRSHARKQLNFEQSEPVNSSMGETSTSSLNVSDCSMDSHPSTSHAPWPLPIQVDGASDDTFLPVHQDLTRGGGEEGDVMHGERTRNQDSFSSLDSSYLSSVSSEAEEGGHRSVKAQLASLQGLLDVDLTEASSDEEEEGEGPADPLDQ